MTAVRLLLGALAAATALASAAAGQLGDTDGLSSNPGTVVVLRGLDKITAETRDFEAVLHEPSTFGSLTITPRYCRKRPPEETPETVALLEIADRTTDGRGVEGEPVPIFSGFMFASSPGLNGLEHPVFDVWVLDCLDAPTAAVEGEAPRETELAPPGR